MFCPLCRSEYRREFSRCSDCKIDLIASFEQAQRSSERLWKGERQGVADRILEALDREEILAHYKHLVEKVDLTWGNLLLGRWGQHKFTHEVWVLRKDMDRARAATRNLIAD